MVVGWGRWWDVVGWVGRGGDGVAVEVGGGLLGREVKADSGGLGSVVVVVIVRRARRGRGRREVGGWWESWEEGWSSARFRGVLNLLRDMVVVLELWDMHGVICCMILIDAKTLFGLNLIRKSSAVS